MFQQQLNVGSSKHSALKTKQIEAIQLTLEDKTCIELH